MVSQPGLKRAYARRPKNWGWAADGLPPPAPFPRSALLADSVVRSIAPGGKITEVEATLVTRGALGTLRDEHAVCRGDWPLEHGPMELLQKPPPIEWCHMSDSAQNSRHLEVVQAVRGTFHHFDLARELRTHGYLRRIYSDFPWQRLKREGVAKDKVSTFPWIHTPHLLLASRGLVPAALNRELNWFGALCFDAWVTKTLPRCDAFISASAAGVSAGQKAQRMGAKYFCDRGSSHIRYQDRILREEFDLWGVEHGFIVDPRFIAREETAYEKADAITVPSEFARRSFLEMGVPAEKLHRIPYGVRLDRFRRTSEPPAGRFEVLFVGAGTLQKGVPWLLQAFARVRHPHKRLRVVGGMKPELLQLLPRLPRENVEFLGRLPQSQLPDIMSSSHVMVMPSVQEGLALVQGQAMACGCPLISTLHTGGEDLFTNGVEGFLVPIRSPEAIAEKLQQLADDPALQQRMSEAALRRVRQIGGWKEYGDAWIRLLHSAAAFA
ncbi:MAG: glycosyltransferase family 4 protein [Acidobacteriaceae bacterium]